MRSIGEPTGAEPGPDKPAQRLEVAGLNFDHDLPEIQHLETDIDLDMFSAEPVRLKDEAAAPAPDVRPTLHVVPPQGAVRAAEPEAVQTTGDDQSDADFEDAEADPSAVEESPLRAHGSLVRRAMVAAVGLSAIAGAIWWAGTLKPAVPETTQSPAAAAASEAPDGPTTLPYSPLNIGSADRVPASSPAAATPTPSAPAPSPAPPASVVVAPATPAARVVGETPRAAAAPSDAAGVVAVGWLKVDAPIPLDITNQGNVIGTTRADRTLLAAGDYDLVFANDQIGFRETRRVSIAAGRLRQLELRIPDGLISLNARPWADVTIDGKPVGETPLGNITVSAGSHQVVFTHPQLGQRRIDTVVRVGQHVRLNVNLTSDQD